MRKHWTIWLAAAAMILALLMAGCSGETEPAATEAPTTLTAVMPEATPERELMKLSLTPQRSHPALMACDGSGAFYPGRTVSRSLFCELLAAQLRGLPEGETAFSDFRLGNKGYKAAASLYEAGLLRTDHGAFRPEDDLTRGELAETLSFLSESLPGVSGERVGALAAEVAAGDTARGDAAGRSDEPILREELAVVLVRLVGREPDEAGLFLAECLPADIALDDFAWGYIADAVTEGPVRAPEAGVHRAYGWLYATWEEGTLVRDMDLGVWTFGLDGRYTTGDEELDAWLAQALEDSGANDLTGDRALAAAYLYVKYNSEYLVRPEDEETVPVGETGWEYERAARFFRYGGGTCYGYAAAFGLMARALGETAYIVSAEVNQYHGPHAFVVIPRDGVDRIYDVELEATRQNRHGDLALFDILNFSVYSYWYTPDWG